MNEILVWAGYAGGIGLLLMAIWGGIRAEELFDAEHVPTWGGIGLLLVMVAAILDSLPHGI